MSEVLPAEVVEADRQLDGTVSRASEELAELRWHWTLDDDNPARVSVREYARQVGKSYRIVYVYARGYADRRKAQGDPHVGITPDLSESIARADMGAETQAATEAVATSRGTSFTHTRDHRPTEIRRVREMARERAELNETTVEEEAPRVADWIVKSEHVEQERTEDRRQKLGLRFVEMEGYLAGAKRQLTKALTLAHSIEWDDECRELLHDTVENVKALLGLIDAALVGTADVDWDAEMRKLTEVDQ